MDPTTSYKHAIPLSVLARFDFFETRNAGSILRATNPEEFDDIISVLSGFAIDAASDISEAGGNESKTAARLNRSFRYLGWREAAYSITIKGELVLKGPGRQGDKTSVSEQETTSYLIDNLKGRVAADVEWHAKDGNLDRDFAAYRALYENGIIDVALMITMSRDSMRQWAQRLDSSTKKFQTSTTTNLEKAKPRLIRGDGGGCPILVVAICDRTT